MSSSRLSVVIACYEQAHLLDRALDSIDASDYPRQLVEVIVVDDGSRDDPAAVVARYGDRARLVRRENGGLVAATNTGLEHATGELISFLDADDELHPQKLRLQAEHLDAHPQHGLVFCDLEVIDEDGTTLAPSFFAAHPEFEVHQGRVLGHLLHHNFISAAQMIRASLRELWQPIPAVAPSCQDWPLAVTIAQRWDVGLLPQPLYRYREHRANMNLGIDDARRDQLLALEVPWRRWMFSRLDLARAAAPELVQAWQGFLPNVGVAVRLRGGAIDEVLPVTPDDRASAQELRREARSLADRDPRAALALLVRALGLDPLDEQVHADLRAFAAALRDADRLLGLAPGSEIVVADGVEAAEDPRLLREIADGAAGDAAVVLLCPPDDAPAVERLISAVAAAGLDADGGPDLVAVSSTAVMRAQLAGRAAALLSRRPAPEGLDLIPAPAGAAA